MSDEAQKKGRKTRTQAPVTLESAQEEVLAALAKAGARGTFSAFGKNKRTREYGATYQEAVDTLAGEERRELFIDRRGKKPKYYLWVYRPKLPTPESVGQKILPFIQGAHPRVYHAAGLAKDAGLAKEEKPLVPAALQMLCERGDLATLEFAPTAKSRHTLYVATRPFAAGGTAAATAGGGHEESPQPLSGEDVRRAYDALVRQMGFPAIPIAALQKATGAPMDALKELLRQEHQAGAIALSIGDWSIADEEERCGVIELHGHRYLQVRWL
jgi:hypothetical protein